MLTFQQFCTSLRVEKLESYSVRTPNCQVLLNTILEMSLRDAINILVDYLDYRNISGK